MEEGLIFLKKIENLKFEFDLKKCEKGIVNGIAWDLQCCTNY